MQNHTISQQEPKTDDKKKLSLCSYTFLESRKTLLEYLWTVQTQPWNYQSHAYLAKVTGLSIPTVKRCLSEFRELGLITWRYWHRHSNWYTLLPSFFSLSLFAGRIKRIISLTLLLAAINGKAVQDAFDPPFVYRNLYLYDITSNSRRDGRCPVVPGENYELLKQEKVPLATDVFPYVFKKRARKEKMMSMSLDNDMISQQKKSLEAIQKHLPLTTHGLLLFFAFHPTVIGLLVPVVLNAKAKFKTQEEIMKWIIQSAKNISNEKGLSYSFATYHTMREAFRIDKEDKNLIDMAALADLAPQLPKKAPAKIDHEFREFTPEQFKEGIAGLASHVFKDTGFGTHYQEKFRDILLGKGNVGVSLP